MHLPVNVLRMFVSDAVELNAMMQAHGPKAETRGRDKIRPGRTFAGPELMLKGYMYCRA